MRAVSSPRNRKDKEEAPTVFFSNPYYADVRAPLNPPPPPAADYDVGDNEDGSWCAGGVSVSQASTPVKRPLHAPPVPHRAPHNFYTPPPALAALGGSPLVAVANDYDEITAQKLLYAAGGGGGGRGGPSSRGTSHEEEEGGAVGGGGGGVYEDADLVDHHYDYTTGENHYESVENVRLAMEQNARNEQQEEERYVPFQFDSPDPGQQQE